MTNDLYCSTDGCGDFENNVSKILSDISTLQNKDLDQDARLEALEMLDISEVITKSNNALLVANAIDAKATLALSTASTADGKATGAVSDAANAVLTAGDALTDSATALNKAIEAYNAAGGAVSVAGYADAKAVSALSASGTAVSDAAAAVITANAADGKADIAVYDSNVAVVKVNKAIITDAQTLTTGQKAQARTNIDAVGKSVSETITGQWSFDRPPIIPISEVNKYEVSRTANVLTSIMGMVNVVPMMYKNGDTTITEFTLQNNGIGTKAFFNCTNLENVNFINTLVIGGSALSGCKKLKTAVLSSAYRLDYGAFNGSGVEHVDIEREVRLSGVVFKKCLSLTTIVFRSATSIKLLSTDIFDLTPIADGTGFIYVPDALYDAYLIATNWATYASQIKKISELNE